MQISTEPVKVPVKSISTTLGLVPKEMFPSAGCSERTAVTVPPPLMAPKSIEIGVGIAARSEEAIVRGGRSTLDSIATLETMNPYDASLASVASASDRVARFEVKFMDASPG